MPRRRQRAPLSLDEATHEQLTGLSQSTALSRRLMLRCGPNRSWPARKGSARPRLAGASATALRE